MTSAYTSKTRTGKVIYSNLYTETKSKDRSGGIEFSTNDFGPSDFLKEKMEQERMRKKLVRAKARQKKEKLVEAAQRLKEEEESQMDEYTLACLEEERETSERKQLGREQSARDTNVELPSSFFMTDRCVSKKDSAPRTVCSVHAHRAADSTRTWSMFTSIVVANLTDSR